MYNKPFLVGLGNNIPDINQGIEETISFFGSNTGNIVFSDAAISIFSKPTIGTYHFHQSEISNHDCIILSAANWLNPYSDFFNLARRLENTKLPIFALGMGAQSSINGEIPKLQKGTEYLLKLIAERSSFISSRGVFSCEVMEKYGVKNSVPTGCPSLLMLDRKYSKPNFDREKKLRVASHGTRHGYNNCPETEGRIYQVSMKNKYSLILQSEISEITFLFPGSSESINRKKSMKVLLDIYKEEEENIKLHIENNCKVFFSLKAWINFLKNKSLCFGSRFHGTIVGLLAGIPSILIVHDSRTLEMARIMGIPYVMESDINFEDNAHIDILLRIWEEWSPEISQKIYYNNYLDFFEGNRISTNLKKVI